MNTTPPADRAQPATGPVASWPRRLAALALDWLFANVVAYAVTGGADVWDARSGLIWVPLLCWYVIVVACTATIGASPGQRLLGIAVRHTDGRRVSVITSAVRTLLIALVIPPLVFGRDGRGLHDIVSNTAAVQAS